MSGKRSTKHSLTSSNNDDNLCYHSTTVWRVLLDVFSLSVLLIITVISHFILKPFTRGYFCTDYSIHYPYKSNTVSTTADVLLSTLLPLLWIWLTEFIKLFYYRWYPQTIYYTKLQLCGVRIRNIHPFIRNLYLLTVVFLYGYLTTWVLTEIAKNFVGELRPHFFELCRPNVTCSCSSSCGVNNQVYITNYVCLNTDETAVREGRRSFFSGHASSIFFGISWLIMYIHVSWTWRHLGIIGNLFQTGFAILAFYVGYSRISDFQHHWHDVFVGGLTGALIAFVTFKFILNWRPYDPRFLPYTVLGGVVGNDNTEFEVQQDAGMYQSQIDGVTRVRIDGQRKVGPRNSNGD